jgi:hypothetical protein
MGYGRSREQRSRKGEMGRCGIGWGRGEMGDEEENVEGVRLWLREHSGPLEVTREERMIYRGSGFLAVV